jgi:hypothetical protein
VVTSIGTALQRSVEGVGHRPIAAELGVPEATVRGWLRRARAGARWLAATAMAWAHRLDRDLGRVDPEGSPLGDALTALTVAAAALQRRFGPIAGVWQIIASLTGGRLLAGPSG